ncbi:MAG: hypothetical protein HZA91_18395, partial [Verrucomicrobia bacterium]|nr:hypothetical protein [Verrucomicrobiota bacterium]
RVLVIDAGANGVADSPDHNGNPMGDDILIATTTIGEGIAPDIALSGRFSTSIYPPPGAGAKVYVRVLNVAAPGQATHYGQSSLFTVAGVDVLDVSALGLAATAQALDIAAPSLLAAVSRKVHGAAGTFDLPLTLDPLLSPTVEPRRFGPDLIVLTFSETIAAADGTLSGNEFTLTNATFSSATIVSSNLTLNLTNVVDQAKVTVVLNGLTDLAGNPLAGVNAVKIRVLYGDANQSGSVSVGDMQAVKNKLSQALSSANFLSDVNLSGTITVGDMQVVKNNLTHSVPLGDTSAPALAGTTTIGGPSLLAPAPAPSPAATLGEALGAPSLVWSTNGDEVWAPTIAPDGSSAAWSGRIGNLNVSWVETTVIGPGTLSFEWSVSSELNADFLTFSVDGADQPGRISGEAGWLPLSFSIPAGTHRLRWTYGKNGANAAGLDAGWLRRVGYGAGP